MQVKCTKTHTQNAFASKPPTNFPITYQLRSDKEKRLLFEHIADHLCAPPATHASARPAGVSAQQQQQQHQHHKNLSTACGLLLMFCEDQEVAIRMAAEEQLHRIVRANEHTASTRLLYDLHYELLKNGHQRSLKVALSLFGVYMSRIRQRKVKAYAAQLLPVLLQVARRQETAVLEALEQFVRKFARYLLGALHDNEVRRLAEAFVADATQAECAVKRRYAAQNVCHIVQHSRQRAILARHVLQRVVDGLLQPSNAAHHLLGALGFLRAFLPAAIDWICANRNASSADSVGALQTRVYELFDMCLFVVSDTASCHTVHNAALEVLVVLTDARTVRELRMSEFMTSMSHQQAVHQRNSLRMQWKRKVNAVGVKPVVALPATESENTPVNKIVQDEKSLKIETDDSKAPTETFEPPAAQSNSDTIGSFITSLLGQSNSESVSKFFGKRASASEVSTPSSQPPDVQQQSCLVRHPDDEDDISVQSLCSSSNISGHLSAAFSDLNLSDELPLGARTSVGSAIGSMEFDFATNIDETSMTTAHVQEISNDCADDSSDTSVLDVQQTLQSAETSDLLTGTCQMIVGKFLLAGTRGELMSDALARVSVKNVALQVLSNVVSMRPHILFEPIHRINGQDDIATVPKFASDSEQRSIDAPNTAIKSTEQSCEFERANTVTVSASTPEQCSPHLQLCIIDDHFGANQPDTSISQTTFKQSPPSSTTSEPEILPSIEPETSQFEATHCAKITSIAPERQQILSDVLLYSTNSDPMLRANLVQLVAHFIAAVFNQNHSVEDISAGAITFDQLQQIIFDGLTDESHIVVKQALVAVSLVLEQVLRWSTPAQFICSHKYDDVETLPKGVLPESSFVCAVHIVERVLSKFRAVFDNKYWVVQCKYCELIAGLRFDDIEWQLGGDKRQVMEVSTQHIVIR